MKRYIILFTLLLCTSCNVSAEVIHPVAVPVPNYTESLSVHAFGKMDADTFVDWMYFDIDCERCE